MPDGALCNMKVGVVGTRKWPVGVIKGGSRGGVNGAMVPPLTQKGGPMYLLAWPHLSSVFFLRGDPFIYIFHFFHRRGGQTYSFLSKYDNGRVEPSSKFSSWKSNRKTVPWINVWLNISCAEGLMISTFYDNCMLHYQRYCPIGHRHRKFWVINTCFLVMHHSRASAFTCRTARKKCAKSRPAFLMTSPPPVARGLRSNYS